MKKYLLVQKEFNSEIDYPIKIRPQYARILSSLQKGEKINPNDYIKEQAANFTRKPSSKATSGAAYHAFVVGKKIGVLRDLSEQEIGFSISYDEFCNQETVLFTTTLWKEYDKAIRGDRNASENRGKKSEKIANNKWRLLLNEDKEIRELYFDFLKGTRKSKKQQLQEINHMCKSLL